MIGFAGLSHLGIVTSVATAAKGFDVVAYGPDVALCKQLSQGQLPIFEPDLPELLSKHGARVRFTADVKALAACELVMVSLDVATDQQNRSDLSEMRALLESVTPHVARDAVLVILSQVPPGFTRALAVKLTPLSVFYQVETLIFGRAVERALHPERCIVGCKNPAGTLPPAYRKWLESFGCPILAMRFESAELAKIAVNMFLVSSVTTTNMLAELCEAIGADWAEIAPALRLDQRIGPQAYLSPGLGIAGGNLARDLMTVRLLAREFGTDAGVVDAWLTHSQARRDWVLKELHARVISKLENPVIAIWGLAYKAGTASKKNSPALALIEALSPFSLRAYDPQVTLSSVVQTASPLEACRGAHALAVMTPWPEFSSVNLSELHETMAGRTIIDPFGVFDHQQCSELGFAHFRLGGT